MFKDKVLNKLKIILPIVVLGLGIAGYMGLASLQQPPEQKPPETKLVQVSVVENQFQPMTLTVASYGVVKAKYETELVAQVGGELTYLAPEFIRGGLVKQGQVLAKIDPSDYDVALIQAKANLAEAKANLVQEQAYGKVAKEQWSDIKSKLPTELSLRKPQLEQEKARLKSAEASLKQAQRNLDRTVIRAPYDALIASRHIGPGGYAAPGAVLGRILSTELAEVRLPLAQQEFNFLDNQGIGANVLLTLGKEIFHAKVVRNEGVIDDTSRMAYLVAEIPDPYGRSKGGVSLPFGSYVTAEIEGINAGMVSVLPRHLVTEGKVAVLTPERTLAYREVEVLRFNAGEAVITSGLEQGDKVINSALDYAMPGMALDWVDDPERNTESAVEPDTKLVGEAATTTSVEG
ncbi:efflux RND transporter periplasmic adaptor subunit [Motilimonas sp. KMU-193]|uniref:efflux RND transporter periplasmic adaptor subunit n=1 Tax=Motilimonas sp. KMU-193 TaxID=3388668 RepID=UPI00396B437F